MQGSVHKVSGDRIKNNETICGKCFELPGAPEKQGTRIILIRQNTLWKLWQEEGYKWKSVQLLLPFKIDKFYKS